MRVIVFEKSGPWGSASYYLLEELSWFVLLLFLSLTGTFEGVRNAGLTEHGVCVPKLTVRSVACDKTAPVALT